MAMTRGRKILIGCLVAVGVVIIAAVGSTVFFFSWLQTPGEPLEGNRLLDDQTRVYLEVRFAENDPGTRELVKALFNAQQDLEPHLNDLPPFLAWIQGMQRKDIPDEELDKLLPFSAILSRQAEEQDAEGGASFVVNLPAASNGLRLFDRLFSWTAGQNADVEVLSYKEEEYYRLLTDGEDVWMSVVDANLVCALQESPTRSVIDRLLRPPEAVFATRAPLTPLLATVPDRYLLRLAAFEQTGALLDLIEVPLPELAVFLSQLIGDSESVIGWLQVESAEVLVGELQAHTGSDFPDLLRPGDTVRLELYGGQLQLSLEPMLTYRAGWQAWRLRAEGILAGARRALDEATSGL